MQRRDPRQPAFDDDEMRRLTAKFGPEKAYILEQGRRIQLQAESDLRVNMGIASDILEAMRLSKAACDHSWLLSEAPAIQSSEVEAGGIALRTSGFLRILTRNPGIWDEGLSAYLYATQYLFVVESTVTLALDKTLFLFEALQRCGVTLSWETYRTRQLKVSLFKKLATLEQLGAAYFSAAINRELRNNLAHAHFAVKENSGLLIGPRNRDQRLFSLADIVDEMDKTVDLVQVSMLVSQAVLNSEFLVAK